MKDSDLSRRPFKLRRPVRLPRRLLMSQTQRRRLILTVVSALVLGLAGSRFSIGLFLIDHGDYPRKILGAKIIGYTLPKHGRIVELLKEPDCTWWRRSYLFRALYYDPRRSAADVLAANWELARNESELAAAASALMGHGLEYPGVPIFHWLSLLAGKAEGRANRELESIPEARIDALVERALNDPRFQRFVTDDGLDYASLISRSSIPPHLWPE